MARAACRRAFPREVARGRVYTYANELPWEVGVDGGRASGLESSVWGRRLL